MRRMQAARARFGPFELDLRAGELHANGNGQPLVLAVQVFQLLQILIEHDGDIATREEIKRKLWPNDTIVEFDHSINTAIKKLRRALDDSAEEPRYIETIPRRGYRLMVPVEWVRLPEGGAEDSSSGGASLDVSFRAERSEVEEPAVGSADALSTAKVKVGPLTGKVVSHYRVLEVIGGGGMGLVYRAEDLKLGRAVALKVLPEEVVDDPRARERFEREAKAVSALSHVNICPIYEFDEYEGLPFLVMELLQGKTLRDHLAEGHFRLTQPEGLEIAIQIASGLGAAHEKGITHRDIKPANIFITEKNVAKILDFGVAKVVSLSEPSPAVILSEELSDESKDPYNNEGPGIGVLRLRSSADGGLTPLRMTDHEHERGNQSHPGLIPAQFSYDGVNGAPEGAPLQALIPEGTSEAVFLQNPGLKPGEEDNAQRRAEARLFHPKETTLTRTGMKLGTAGYMSPEQIRGEPLDARTDIFSFGLVLYEMATGQRAFTGETAAMLEDAILNQSPLSARELNSTIPAKLTGIIDKALEKDRCLRYQSAAEMRIGLIKLQRSRFSVPVPGLWRWTAAVAVAVAISLVGGLYWRSRHRIRFTDKDTIVLAHVINTTGDAVNDDALDWPLSRALQESPFLSVLYPIKVLDTLGLMKVSNVAYNVTLGAKLTPDLAREVCLQSNSKAFVTASIANAGNSYRIALNARDCHSDKILAKVERETKARNDIVKTLGAAGYELRRELGEPEASLKRFNTPLEVETSASLEALQALSDGIRLKYEQGIAAAIPQYKRAVELDPNLALAHMNLGAAYDFIGDIQPGRSHLNMGFNLRERLSQRSRWFIEAIYYTAATGELEKANAAYTDWVRTFPGDVFAHQNFRFLLTRLGQHERAAVEAREAARLLPTIGSYEVLLSSLVYMNRLEDAKAVLNEAKVRGFDNAPLLREQRYRLAFFRGDQASMQEQLNWAMGKPVGGEGVLRLHSLAEAYHGHFRNAHRYMLLTIEAATRTDASNSDTQYESQEALWESEAGVAGARTLANNILTESPGQHAKLRLALALARTREARIAEEVADELGKEMPIGTVMQKFHLPTIRAAIELGNHNPQHAIEILKASEPYELAGTDSFDELWPAYVRGLAYLQADDGQQAATEFQKLLDHSGLVGLSITGALAHLQLARAYAMMGNTDAARKSYQDFLTLWKDADPDIPIYRQAKAEYKKLNMLPATSRQLPAKGSQLSVISHQ